jgi:hypothetical protein
MVSLPMTSVMELRGHRMAIAACFAFQREISSSVLWDFFDSIPRSDVSNVRRKWRSPLKPSRFLTADEPDFTSTHIPRLDEPLHHHRGRNF